MVVPADEDGLLCCGVFVHSLTGLLQRCRNARTRRPCLNLAEQCLSGLLTRMPSRADDERATLVNVVPEALAAMHIPQGETVVEVPKRLMKYLPEDAHAEGDG